GLRPRRRSRDRPVPAVPVCERWLRAVSPLDRAPARPGDRRDRGGDGSRLREPRVPRPQRNRAGRLAWLGAGAGTVFRARLGSRLHAARRAPRSLGAAAPGWTARRGGGQGQVRVYRAELLPAAAGGGPGRVSVVCEPAGARQAIKCGMRNSERGTERAAVEGWGRRRGPDLT